VAPMTIFLAEEQNGQRLAERAFDSSVLAVGRDASECQITFDSVKWPMVSRKHAEFRLENGRYLLADSNSRYGTFVNGRQIFEPTEVSAGARAQFGPGGPVLHVVRIESGVRSLESGVAEGESGVRSLESGVPEPKAPHPRNMEHAAPPQKPIGQPGTMRVQGPPVHQEAQRLPRDAQRFQDSQRFQQDSQRFQDSQRLVDTGGQPLHYHPIPEGAGITVGRGAENDIRLNGLQISNQHARVTSLNGSLFIEDSRSTNGVYVNGTRITSKTPIGERDTVQIGPFLLVVNLQLGIAVWDTRAKTRIDAIDITKVVTNRAGGGSIKLLDDVDLAVQPNEFVGLLGPSGAGKSTLMDALNGMRPASSGLVLINSLDLYEHLDSLKQSIGYVPQDDIIHRELTVYRTLHYVARLRLSRDLSDQEMDQIINEVMDLTGLSERRDVPVGQLSGGQRKRVSIAVELITKPSIIFLDEPTSGLDPATEEKIMKLFRHIAESGRTVILTTHAMENVKLFDKIVVLMRGKLVFYGAPSAALQHVQADSFKDLYDKLEAPIDERLRGLRPLGKNATAEQKQAYKLQREQAAEEVAEDWKQRFMQTEQYKLNILEPLGSLKGQQHAAPAVKHQHTVTDAVRQWKTLAQRYMEVLRHDKFNLLILFGQAPIVAFITYLVVDTEGPRDFVYFVLALVAVWFGTSIAAREIIRERAVYNRERMVNLGLLPYVGSKLFDLSLIVGLQCILLFGTLKLFDLAGIMTMPGDYHGLPQLLVMILTSIVGISVGLFVSAIVKTSEMATSLVPLLLIPQILFCGLVGVPKGPAMYVGAIMPATWAFDGIKRLSSELGVLRGKDEEAMPSSKDEGRGLYKEIKHKNEELIDQKQKEVEDYKAKSEDKFEDFDKQMNDYQKRVEKWNMTGRREAEPKKPPKPTLDPVPPKVKVVEVPDDLSGYVDFLHAWGNKWLNPIVLLFMFIALTTATIAALRSQDIG
jgi:ABC-type multidrug transport system ATPase subunit/pSer/pThr/pTyr-binding forkhead associated (FHA) protein